MIHNYLLPYLFGISICFVPGTIAREAIVNGFIIWDDPFPYQVSVQLKDCGHVCGGGIIGDRFILTAAHCVLSRTRQLRGKPITILAGTNNLNRTEPPAVSVRVEKVFFPKEFHSMVDFSHGDIAILRLVDSLQLERRTNLKKLSFPRYHHLDEIISVIVGFGWNKYNEVGNRRVGSTDGRLRLAVTDVLSEENCERAYPHGVFLRDKHLCAKIRALHFSYVASRYGTCIGDSGSPLVYNDTIMIGILSRISDHCDERLEPALYVHIVHYVRMIVNVLDHNRDSEMIALDTYVNP